MRAFAVGCLIGLSLFGAPVALAAPAIVSPAGEADPGAAVWRYLWQREGWDPGQPAPMSSGDPSAPKVLAVIEALTQGEHAKAAKLCQEATALAPKSLWPLLAKALTDAATAGGPTGLPEARLAVAMAPQSALVRMVLAEALGGTGAYQAALPQWLIAAGLAPDHPLTQIKLGEGLWLSGDTAAARRAFQYALSLSAREPVAAAAIGTFYLRQHERATAAEYYEAAFTARPEDPSLVQMLESLYINAEQPLKAMHVYERAILARPQHWPLYFRLAGLAERYAPSQMPALLNNAERRFDTDPTALVQLGAIAVEVHRYAQAERAFQRALRLDPNQTAAYAGLANVYIQSGKPEAAVVLLERAVAQRPDFAEGLHLLGVLALQQSRGADAVRYLERASTATKGAMATQLALALAYRAVKDPAKALTILQKQVDENPRAIQVWLSLGDAYMDSKAYPSAIDAYRKATALEPLNDSAYYALGNALSQSDKSEEAIRAYQRAILLDIDSLDARNNLGNVYLRRKQSDAAIDEFERILMIDPGYATAYYNLACAYAQQHDSETAFKLLDRALVLDRKLRDVARGDSDFDTLRHEDRFRRLVGDPPAQQPGPKPATIVPR